VSQLTKAIEASLTSASGFRQAAAAANALILAQTEIGSSLGERMAIGV